MPVRHSQNGAGKQGVCAFQMVEVMATATLEKSAGAAKNPNSPDRKFPLERTRNIGIAGHIDAGKTLTKWRRQTGRLRISDGRGYGHCDFRKISRRGEESE